MAEEFESVELEISEEDILYYIVDEDDNQVGFAIMEDGEEVEYYFEGDADMFEVVEDDDAPEASDDADEGAEEAIEIEVSEEDIIYHIVDENDVEIGFAVMEDGEEVEYYYEEVEVEEAAGTEASAAKSSAPAKAEPEPEPEEPKEHGYLYKMASIAGHRADKTRKKAEVQLDKVRGVAEKQVDKAAEVVEAGGKKLKEKREENDLGITREGIAETTADLNVIAKEGAETAKELKAAYDDIMDSFGFLVPGKIRRRLP